MVIFHSYVSLPEGNAGKQTIQWPKPRSRNAARPRFMGRNIFLWKQDTACEKRTNVVAGDILSSNMEI